MVSTMVDEAKMKERLKNKLKSEYESCKLNYDKKLQINKSDDNDSQNSEQEDLWTNCLEIVRRKFENNFTCHVCNKGFRDRWRLKLHEKVHNSSGKLSPHIFNAYMSLEKTDNGEPNDNTEGD